MLRQIGPLPGPVTGPAEPNAKKAPGADGTFERLLARETGQAEGMEGAPATPGDVRLSAHARERLETRSIPWTEQHAARLGEAVDRAGEKGANKSLVLLDDLALVVSVRNRVVITALDDANARSGVFTNIDSAVIA